MKTTIEKRVISAAPAALTLALASCGQTGSGTGDNTTEPTDTTEKTVPEETVDTRYVPDLEVRNFSGKELRIVSFECPNVHYNMVPEEETGDTISDALFIRNRNITDKYNVRLIESLNSWNNDAYRSSILAVDDSYDIISVSCPAALPWYREGLIIPYDDLPNVDLDKGYWDKSINESLSIDGLHYVAEGAYNIDIYDLTFCLLVSKPLCEQYRIEGIYKDVSDGKWTYDMMKNYMMLVTSDLNGDSVMDENDQYGYTSHPKMVAPGFWIGADELSIIKDENDHPVINMTDPHFVEVFDKIFNVVWDSNASYLTVGDQLDIPTECRKVFSENSSLFIDMSFFYIEAMRGVETDFGIIPYPKFDENQSEYHSRVC